MAAQRRTSPRGQVKTHRRPRESFSIDTLVGMVGDLASKGADLAGKVFAGIVSGAATALAVRTGFHLPPEAWTGLGTVMGAAVASVSGRALETVRSEWQKARTAKPGRHRAAGAASNRAPPGTGTTLTTAAPATKGPGMSLKDEMLELLETARGQYDAQDQTSGMINDKAEQMTSNLVLVGSDEQAQAVDQARNAAVEAIAQARAAAEKGLDDAIALVHQAIP